MSNPFITLFKKPLNSISDEITTKFRTPFFTTYIIVWVIKNNLFIYDLFFNEAITTKRDLLKSQFNISEWNFYWELLLTLLISLVVLIAFYFFLNISRTITVFSEERVKLNLLSFLKSKTITSIDETNHWKNKSDNLNKVNRELEDEISNLRSMNGLHKTNLDTQEIKIKDLIKNSDATISRMKNLVNDFSKSIKTTENNNTISDLVKSIENEHKRYEKSKKGPTFIRG